MVLTALAGAWVLGLFLGSRRDIPPLSLALWSIAVLPLVALVATLRGRLPGPLTRRALWACGAGLLLLAGTWRASPGPDAGDAWLLGLIAEETTALRGQVVSDPERLATAYRFRFSNLQAASDSRTDRATGTVLVTARPSRALAEQRDAPHFRYGDVLLLEGVVAEPPVFEEFDYRDYLAGQGIPAVISFPRATLLGQGEGNPLLAGLYAARRGMASALAEALPEPQAATVQALLLGLRRDLSPELREAFVQTGTSHLLAVSGLHVGVLLGVLLALGSLLFGGARRSLLLALAGLWLFAGLTGMAAPVTRVAIMGSLYLGARALGREGASLPALALAAAVMAGLNPRLLGDVSFQLSFTAVAAIILVAPPIERWLTSLTKRRLGTEGGPDRLIRGFNLALAAGVAATLGTLPLVALAFGRVSPLSIPATLLALPALPLILVGGGMTALLGLVWAPLAHVAGWATWVPTTYLLTLVRTLSQLPGASVPVGAVASALVGLYYAGGLLLLRAVTGRRASTGAPMAKALRWVASIMRPLTDGSTSLSWMSARETPSSSRPRAAARCSSTAAETLAGSCGPSAPACRSGTDRWTSWS